MLISPLISIICSLTLFHSDLQGRCPYLNRYRSDIQERIALAVVFAGRCSNLLSTDVDIDSFSLHYYQSGYTPISPLFICICIYLSIINMESKQEVERKYIDLAKRNQSLLSSLSSHVMLSPLSEHPPLAQTKHLYDKVVQSSHRAINQNDALNSQIAQADDHIQLLSSNIATLKRQAEYLQSQIHSLSKSIKHRASRLNDTRINRESKQLEDELIKLSHKHKQLQQQSTNLSAQITSIATANKANQFQADQMKHSISSRQTQHQSRISQLDNELYRWKREVDKLRDRQ